METEQSKVVKCETGGHRNTFFFFFFHITAQHSKNVSAWSSKGAGGAVEQVGSLKCFSSKWCFALGRFSVTDYDSF